MRQASALARHKHTCVSLRFLKETCSGEKNCCVLTPRAHLDLFPCANRPAHATTLLHSHAFSTLGSHSEMTHVPANKLPCSRAGSTLGSPSVRKKTCSCDNTAAFASCEHTWISLRAQKNLFRRKDRCVLTSRAHLGLAPCANRPVHATALLRSYAASTLGSRSVRIETCSIEKTPAISRCPPR